MIPGTPRGANIKLLGDGGNIRDIYAIKIECGYVTAWHPTPAELDALNKGAAVYVSVLSDPPPPVHVGVSDDLHGGLIE